MSILSGYRYSTATSGATSSSTAIQIGSFKISGLGNTAGLICCMYKYDATNNIWIPYTG